MDMHSGTVLNWPVSGGWLDNGRYLRPMRTVWRAWRFFTGSAKDWTADDLAYQDWLNENKPETKTNYQLWLENRNNGRSQG